MRIRARTEILGPGADGVELGVDDEALPRLTPAIVGAFHGRAVFGTVSIECSGSCP